MSDAAIERCPECGSEDFTELPGCPNPWHAAREYAGRSLGEIRDWIDERLAHERRNAPTDRSSVGAGMTMGALETLEAEKAWLNGDDEA
jgi:hypothetical protein